MHTLQKRFIPMQNGIFSAMPSLVALMLHLIIGPLFDCVRAKQIFSVTVVRKIFHVIGIIFLINRLYGKTKDHHYLNHLCYYRDSIPCNNDVYR
jgi:undecaprenyl pyrophosphate phosphatase UppP